MVKRNPILVFLQIKWRAIMESRLVPTIYDIILRSKQYFCPKITIIYSYTYIYTYTYIQFICFPFKASLSLCKVLRLPSSNHHSN